MKKGNANMGEQIIISVGREFGSAGHIIAKELAERLGIPYYDNNFYCKGKWGDSRNYDISVNSSKLGIEKTTDMLENYIKERMNV